MELAEPFLKSFAGDKNKYKVVSLLVSAGANRNRKLESSTALISAYATASLEMCTLLLDTSAKKLSPADPNLCTPSQSPLCTTIKRLADKKLAPDKIQSSEEFALFKLVLAKGADPDKTIKLSEKKRVTPLILATTENLVPVIKELLAAKADANKKPKKGKTALEIACINDFYEAAQSLLREHAKISSSLKKNKSLSTRIFDLLNKKEDIAPRMSRSSSLSDLTKNFFAKKEAPRRINLSLTSSTSSSTSQTPQSRSGLQTPKERDELYSDMPVFDPNAVADRLQQLALAPRHPSRGIK